MRAECERLKIVTGIEYSIDHIIPLSIGGKHHHSNLQIMPKWLNILKRANPWWEYPGYKCWRDVPEKLRPRKIYGEAN